MNNALDRRQSDTSSFEIVGPMKSLKNSEQFVHVLHIKADAIIFDEYHDAVQLCITGSNFNFGCLSSTRELDRIRNQIHEGEFQHRPIPIQIWQRSYLPRYVPSFCLMQNLALNLIYQLVQADHGFTSFGTSDPGKGKQV